MRKGFLGTTCSYFGRYSWCALNALSVLIALTIVFALQGWPYFRFHPERFVWAILIAFLATIIPPVLSMSRQRNRHMLYVAIWGVTITTIVLISGYMSFFLYVKDDATLEAKYQPILALAPVLSGLMLAAVGWYIHYQKTAKDARTAAAFKILMDTRTSAEFLRFQRELRIVYPPGCNVQEDDENFFPPCSTALEELKILEYSEETDKEKRAALRRDIDKLKALTALSYLLNHYEFVAQAIRAGDLDEDLLYETVSPSIVALFERGSVFIKHVQEEQPLAFQHIEKRVQIWRQRLMQENTDALKVREGV